MHKKSPGKQHDISYIIDLIGYIIFDDNITYIYIHMICVFFLSSWGENKWMTILFPSGNLQAKAGSMFDKVVASMGLTEYAKLVGPCLDLLKFFFVFFYVPRKHGET